MHADTPPESIHMMDAGALDMPGTTFFVLRDGGRAVGMGAFKRLDETHAEIKSMHVLAEERGRGLSRRLLDHLMREAQANGIRRLSLETGSHPSFLAARRLYERAGFTQCPPFEGYGEDPNSYYMTCLLG
ncbi:MAG: GNAT family N-acetyltransferase [Gemmobacter sp.]|nr:GNAT family N-acetyltransferase [Gemmobacter sp.]